MSHLPGEVPDPKDTLTAALATLEAAPVAVRFQVLAANFDESVRTADGNHSVLVYVAMPLGDHTMSSLEILRNTIYEEGVKYAVGAYNISGEACEKLPDGLAVLRYCLKRGAKIRREAFKQALEEYMAEQRNEGWIAWMAGKLGLWG